MPGSATAPLAIPGNATTPSGIPGSATAPLTIPGIAQVFDNHTKYIILLYNPKLFEYILKNKREFMDSFDINYYLPNLTCNLESIKLAIEHYDISQEVLMKTYIKSIENFNLETSEFIDTKLI